MISIIVGTKGNGKTKKLINLVDNAVATSLGNVVVVEKEPNLGSNITTTDIFIDATLKVIGRDYLDLVYFLKRVDGLSKESGANFVFTISEDKEKLPEEVFEICNLID